MTRYSFLDIVVSDDSGVDYARLDYKRTDGRIIPHVIEQPRGMTTSAGQLVQFHVRGNPGAGPYTYLWRRNLVPLADSARISGSTTDTLIILNSQASDIGSYDCVLWGANSCNPVAALSSARVPLNFCRADIDNGSGEGIPDGGVTIEDLLYYLDQYAQGTLRADLDDGTGTGTPDGGVTIEDLLYFLVRYEAGC